MNATYKGHPATLTPINGKMLSDCLRIEQRIGQTMHLLVDDCEEKGREAFRAGLPPLPCGIHPCAGLSGSQAFVIGWYAEPIRRTAEQGVLELKA